MIIKKTFSFLGLLAILVCFSDIAQAHYHPAIGRFVNRDPIEERGGVNIYAFVRNDVINNWDKLGNAPGDEHTSLHGAESSAAKFIAEKTAFSRMVGELEYSTSFYSHTDWTNNSRYNRGSFHIWTKDKNGLIEGVAGLEYGMRIFYVIEKGEESCKYVEGTLIQGLLPHYRDYRDRGRMGLVSVGDSTLLHPEKYTYFHLESELHTHNLGVLEGFPPFLNPANNKLVPAFKQWSISKNPPSKADLRRKIKGNNFVVYEGGEKKHF